MTRTSYRRYWIIGVFLLLGVAFYLYHLGEEQNSKISRATAKRDQLNRDLRTGNQLSAQLVDLDNFTIDENNTTQLDVLRHLGLERSALDFKPARRQSRKIGQTELFERGFALTGEMTYAEALSQIDALHNTKKLVLNTIDIADSGGTGDKVNLKVTGTLYGLEKK